MNAHFCVLLYVCSLIVSVRIKIQLVDTTDFAKEHQDLSDPNSYCLKIS